MTYYTRLPNTDDFLRWVQENPEDYKKFYKEHILPIILQLEPDEYFGTEGFDKRFA